MAEGSVLFTSRNIRITSRGLAHGLWRQGLCLMPVGPPKPLVTTGGKHELGKVWWAPTESGCPDRITKDQGWWIDKDAVLSAGRRMESKAVFLREPVSCSHPCSGQHSCFSYGQPARAPLHPWLHREAGRAGSSCLWPGLGMLTAASLSSMQTRASTATLGASSAPRAEASPQYSPRSWWRPRWGWGF